MGHATAPTLPGCAQYALALIGALIVALSAACSGPGPSPSAPDPSPVRASKGPAATVVVEKVDLYRAREVPGVVEQRPERTVRSGWTGVFRQAPGIRKDGKVRKGALVGTVRACLAPTRPGLEASGDPTSDTAADPSQSGPATSTGPQATTPTCQPQWHAVRAPAAGTITDLADGDVTRGAKVATIRPPGYLIRATITDPASIYDLMRPPPTGKTRILGGPAGFAVRYERRTYNPVDGSVVLVLSVPPDITVVEGLRTSTAFVVSRRTAVPTLPVTAVQGTTGVGQVVLVDGGRTVVTPVKLGQYDASHIEVTGLPPAARVLRFPLASDFLVAP